MNARSLLLTAVALSSASAAFADPPERQAPAPRPAAREQTVLTDLADGMRQIVRAAVPEISLPAIELKVPTLNAARR